MAQKKKSSQLNAMLERLNKYFEDEDYYEAQQMYKTLYSRYKGRGKLKQGTALILHGTKRLLEHKQGNAGGELANVLIDAYKSTNDAPTEKQLETIVTVADLFPANAETAFINFLKAAIKWTADKGENAQGSPQLHFLLAKHFAAQGHYHKAQRYYLRADQPEEHSDIVLTWSKEGYPSELDLFIARTVLQYLCLENMKGANAVFDEFKTKCGDNFPDSPMMNFIGFLLLTVERDAGPLFETLRQKYQVSLARDSQIAKYVDKVGETYFDIRGASSGGILGGLLDGL